MADVDVLLRAQGLHGKILDDVERIIGERYVALGSWSDDRIAQFVAEVEAILGPAQARMAAIADATMARLAGDGPVGVPVEVYSNVRALDLADQYRRPFVKTWTALSKGDDLDQAVDAGRHQAATMAKTDTQIAYRNSAHHVVTNQPRIVGYRRVLTGASCKFCAAASTKRYKREALMPLHSHCDCGIAPIIDTRDPGAVINRETLANLKSQGPDYWKQNGFVDEKGLPIDPENVPASSVTVGHEAELGPVLIPAA